MAEQTYRSPGVGTREIDLSGPTSIRPSGIPAGIIGTANQGPAFVPITVATFADFVTIFGETDGKKFGPLALSEWMKNSSAGTYLRVLGVGDGKKRLASAGTDSVGETIPAGGVKNAGFIVGAPEVGENGSITIAGSNPYAGLGGVQGRTYFMASLMSESAGSDYLSSAGLQSRTRIMGNTAVPILRGVIMVPSGVVLGLSSSDYSSPMSASAIAEGRLTGSFDAGSTFGSVNVSSTADYRFTMFLNGFKDNSGFKNIITASLNPQNANYFANVFNTDPSQISKAGHYLYAHYDVDVKMAVVTSSGVSGPFVDASTTERRGYALTGSGDPALMLLTSSEARNTGTAAIPNFENFSDRFRTASSPWVISQTIGGKYKNLFRIHSLDDGDHPNTVWKISIDGLAKSNNNVPDYGKFNLRVRKFGDSDAQLEIMESFIGVDLNPKSPDYIARRIGNQHKYFDFDKAASSQKLVIDGAFSSVSRYIRVEMHSDIENGAMEVEAIPTGFRGPNHLVTSGSSILDSNPFPPAGEESSGTHGDQTYKAGGIIDAEQGGRVVEPPVPMRRAMYVGPPALRRIDRSLHWGAQFKVQSDPYQPNKDTRENRTMHTYTKYFPKFNTGQQQSWVGANEGTADSAGTVYDCDRFNNNLFSLEKIQILTKSDGTDKVDGKAWEFYSYRRNGVLSASLLGPDNIWNTTTRFLSVEKDFGETASKFAYKFTFFVQGGFDGVNIFDKDKANLANVAAAREMLDTNQGEKSGPTVAAYLKSLSIMAEKSDVDISILAIPGIRERAITNTALTKTEERFDAIYVMDIEEKDTANNAVTSSLQKIGVNNTVADFKGRVLDSSFGAAYFPDVVIMDPYTLTDVRCPPSVATVGALALNDRIAYPWSAPAGFTRGALKEVKSVQVNLSVPNLDELYDVDINPITVFPSNPMPVIWGQKTLQAAASALDRVNVRRLLIDVRRKVRSIGDRFLFEPNRESTLARFSTAVEPVLASIQERQGLDRYKVLIDTSTTTQADVENNTIRGKIFLQPTRAVEFISLSFEINNNGTEI